MRHLRGKLTYANVMATLALFVALGGSSYAALTITGRSVKDSSLTGKDIKNSSLTSGDVRNNSLLKKDFKAGQLPAGATGATGATGAAGPQGPKGDTGAKGDKGDKGDQGQGLGAAEAFHSVGAAGEPGFLNSWANYGGGLSTAAFYKDQLGIVHLKGSIKSGTTSNGATGNVFILPAGYRPTEILQFATSNAIDPPASRVAVLTTGDVRAISGDNTVFYLDGITFRAG